MIRKVRILVETVAQAKAAQEHLFANGCVWMSGDTNVRHLYVTAGDKISLFVGDHGRITWGGTESFISRTNIHLPVIEFTFETKEEVKSVKMLERPKTVLFGKTYFTDELEARLAGLEVATV